MGPFLNTNQGDLVIKLSDINTLYIQNCNYSEKEISRITSICQKLADSGSNYEVKYVKNHWLIPDLAKADPVDWIANKRHVLVIGRMSNMAMTDSGRSTDFIPPSHANGCFSSCIYCVEKGTLISTPSGQIPVEQIQSGSDVISYDTNSDSLLVAQASHVVSRQVSEIYEISVDGRTLRVSAEHPLYTKNRGWVEAQHLNLDDELLCVD